MKRKGSTAFGFRPLLGAVFALMALLPSAGLAAIQTNVWYLDAVSNANWAVHHFYIQANARWGINGAGVTNIHGHNLPLEEGTFCQADFLRLVDYYRPASRTYTLSSGTTNTCYYSPYSNTLIVAVAGTPSAAVWQVTAPGEFTNSSAYQSTYTNGATLTPVPTGIYNVVFGPVNGYASPGTMSTNINGAVASVSITGTYTEILSGSYTMTVTFTNPAVVAAGAKWQVDGDGLWRNSGANYSCSTSSPNHTLQYKTITDYYTPPSESVTLECNTNFDRNYDAYANSLSVEIYDHFTNAFLAPWSLKGPPAFTNASAYGTFGTNRVGSSVGEYVNIPTGAYTVTFSATNGYVTPAAVTTNIGAGSPVPAPVTGRYARALGSIIVTVSPTNGWWTFYPYPADFTNYGANPADLTRTNSFTLTNCPAGDYTINWGNLPGYNPPNNQTQTMTSASTNLTFTGNYIEGNIVTVNIMKPGDKDPVSSNYLKGIGWGFVEVQEGDGRLIGTNMWAFTAGTRVTLAPIPTNGTPAPDTNTYDSFFYEWYHQWSAASHSDWESQLFPSPQYVYSFPTLTFTMGTNDLLFSLLFSREYESYDNVGDVDHDHLPDEWERRWLLDPKDDRGVNGQAGNFDGDWIPSTVNNPPWVVTITNMATSYLIADGTAPFNPYAGYPLRGTLLYNGGTPDGYARTNITFNNNLECRGLDDYYRTNAIGTNGLPCWCGNDDPYTDPKIYDTDGDGMCDGWEYYFWRWRSASAFAAGVTNSANLDWVRISPCLERVASDLFVPTDREWDTDNDKFSDGEEYDMGTDPTHADTDGDSMDDYWESLYLGTNSNPLNALDGMANPDNDYYCVSKAATVLTNGTIGTLLTNPVYHAGGSAWIECYTNSGAGLFDLYQDKLIVVSGSLSNRAVGTAYTHPVYFGTNDMGSNAFYKTGHPVWVDNNEDGRYSSGDTPLFNPLRKNEYLYLYNILENGDSPGPGVTSFSPLFAWINKNIDYTNQVTNAVTYVNNQEYLGGDYLGRVSWNAGGFVPYLGGDNDGEPIPGFPLSRNAYSNPTDEDTDSDLIPDGWELYVGLNPNDDKDGGADGDGDGLNNAMEWANALDPLGNVSNSWPKKVRPTDPGVLMAPTPNDPHPADTDWDGLFDGGEYAITASFLTGDDEDDTNTIVVLSNPSGFDSDGDLLPDGWEVYAGSNPGASDAWDDPDGDGLENWREYWTGTVQEWNLCDAFWDSPTYFATRKAMSWDNKKFPYFIPPDFATCPSFLYMNDVFTDLAYLRTHYPAGWAQDCSEYHSILANSPDSDADGMDDFWEVYHGLNPAKGNFNFMITTFLGIRWLGYGGARVGLVDADPTVPGFQFGLPGQPYLRSLRELLDTFAAGQRYQKSAAMMGPFNFGLVHMDADGDGLPNMEEYSYSPERSLYHTDPSPIWRTDDFDGNSFATRNYTYDYFGTLPGMAYTPAFLRKIPIEPIFCHEQTEGFDTDNDIIGDYHEINASAGMIGSDPLDARNPSRNRTIALNGTNDFLRNRTGWAYASESAMTTFSVEAWVRARNPAKAANQVVVEKAGHYDNPYTIPLKIIRANFRLGITNGLPYILYNGRGAMTNYMAAANIRHRLQRDVWTHIAGTYDSSNLTVYVNGEASAVLRTTELPATGFDYIDGDGRIHLTPQTVIVGARDLTPGSNVPSTVIQTTDHFDGLVDEVRVWSGPRSHGEILANKDRRFTPAEVNNTNSTLWSYYTFDDVPDPATEGIVPFGMDILDTTLSFHPTMSWWRYYPVHSTVYTGMPTMAYNYLVTAADHCRSRPVLPPRDDYWHFSTNFGETNLPGYRNTYNPYGEETVRWTWHIDLCLFNGARAVITNSWLATLDPSDPDSSDSDGDGLPDYWEQLYGLDPFDATGDNGTWGDPDFDGLDNRAEYLAGTNPKVWDTDGDGASDYDSRRGPGSRTWGEIYSDGDGTPDTWETQYGLDPNAYDAHLDTDGDGWDNYCEYQAGTDPTDPDSYPLPAVLGSVHYYGTNNVSKATLYVWGLPTNFLDAVAGVGARCDASGNFRLIGLRQGPFKLFAFLDLDNNDAWNGQVGNERAFVEPCGQSEDHPYEMGWADVNAARAGVSDSFPGYGRALWETRTTNSPTLTYELSVNRISEASAPRVFYKPFATAQMGEWDYQAQGIYGLTAGAYQWWVGPSNSYHAVFDVAWPAAVSKPNLLYPRGDYFYYGRNMIAWSMDWYATAYRLQVARQTGENSYTLVCDSYFPAPYRESDGSCRAYLPAYASDWGNGSYFWRIASWNPTGASAWSDVQTFNINLSATNSYWISGEVWYFGKARATNIYVEAFDNPGFGGAPEARVWYPLPCSSNMLKTAFTLRGLCDKTYYVRAFADITPAGGARNGKLDYWESWGFARAPDNGYQPRAINMTNTHFVEDAPIVIRDRDTDNDKLPDGWEMSYFGNLYQTGDMDYDYDGENNLTEYALDFLDTDPTLFDTDGDGLTDYYEHHYGNNEDYDPYDAVSNPDGKSLNPTRWDTDGDGYSDGAEVRRYHTDPLDPDSQPFYGPPCFGPCASPADYDGDGRSDVSLYEPASGMWQLLTWQGHNLRGQFGTASTWPLLGDYDGDGLTDAALYDPLSGCWYVYTLRGQFGSLQFGLPDSEMIPVPADYDGDFRTDLGIFDVPTGMWYVYPPFTGRLVSFQFGNAACIPVPGDYDGDGRCDFAVYHTADFTWYIYTWRGQFTMFQFGRAGCSPVPGDYDGDGRYDFAHYEAATGMWYVFTWYAQFASGQLWAGGIPVAGDYDGDGRRDAGLYDPNTGMWHIYTLSGQAYTCRVGGPSAFPVSGGR